MIENKFNTNSSTNSSISKEAPSPYKVMVVDDSVVIRGIIKRTLETDKNIQVITTAQDGKIAVDKIDTYKDIEVVVLDIEMPVMDGITALPKILAKRPDIKVIMASTLTTRNADISIRAMELGAADYIPKPTSSKEALSSGEFKVELVEKVKALAKSVRNQSRYSKFLTESSLQNQFKDISKGCQNNNPQTQAVSGQKNGITLRDTPNIKPDILAIGSSTGGPQALMEFFKGLDKNINVPVFVTQHMPPKFTTMLAQRIKEVTQWDAVEAEDGMKIEKNKVYIAAGDYHMTVKGCTADRHIELNQGPKVNFCRPSVNVMLESLINIYGNKTLMVMLTGMGEDGLIQTKKLAELGACIFAQDERSSVVWGMPGAVAKAGICCDVNSIAEINNKIKKQFQLK